MTSPTDVHGMDALLTNMEGDLGLPLGSTAIYPILETAQGIRLAYEIATASPRVAFMGGGDLPLRGHPPGRRLPVERRGHRDPALRSKVLIDARAAGIRYPISGMWGGANDDSAGLRRLGDASA